VRRTARLVFLAVLLATGTALATEPAAVPPDGGMAQSGKVTASGPDAIRQVLASRQFQFCHAPDYPLTPAEKEWCDLGAGDNAKACPAFREVCTKNATAKQLALREPISFKLPALGLTLQVLLWLLLGVGLAVLVFALAGRFLDHKPKEDVILSKVGSVAQDDGLAAFAREVEIDVQRLLERARTEAAAGDFRGAISDVYGALLRQFEGAGLVAIEPDQTNGDYLRKVKAEKPALARRMADVVDEVEAAQFGAEAPTRERFDGVWTRVLSLLTERLGPSLLIVWLLLSGGACGQPRADWEYSPSGRAGVVAYLGKRGFAVHERLLSVAKIAESRARQLVLLPGAHLGDEEWTAVKKWVERGQHSVLIAGGPRELPAWIHMRVVEKPSAKTEPVTPTELAGRGWGTLKIRVPGESCVEGKKDDQPVLTRRQCSYAVERWLGATETAQEEQEEQEEAQSGVRLLVLADDFLFRNASLLVADNALALENLLRDGGSTIEWAGDLTGLVSSNPVESVKRGRLGPALLQLAVFFLLFFVCKGARFGRPVQTQKVQRREFAEHVRALGLHYARARGERHALACFGAYATERLRERCGLKVDRSLSALADAVATRTGRPVGNVMRMLLEARDAKAGVPAEKGARDLETVAELCKLLEETGGTSGPIRIQSHV
jgi:hypothetical protein